MDGTTFSSGDTRPPSRLGVYDTLLSERDGVGGADRVRVAAGGRARWQRKRVVIDTAGIKWRVRSVVARIGSVKVGVRTGGGAASLVGGVEFGGAAVAAIGARSGLVLEKRSGGGIAEDSTAGGTTTVASNNTVKARAEVVAGRRGQGDCLLSGIRLVGRIAHGLGVRVTLVCKRVLEEVITATQGGNLFIVVGGGDSGAGVTGGATIGDRELRGVVERN